MSRDMHQRHDAGFRVLGETATKARHLHLTHSRPFFPSHLTFILASTRCVIYRDKPRPAPAIAVRSTASAIAPK